VRLWILFARTRDLGGGLGQPTSTAPVPSARTKIESMKHANPIFALSFVEPIVKLELSLSRASRLWSVSHLEQDGKASIC